MTIFDKHREIRLLMASHAITSNFQPVMLQSEGKIIAYEALIRGPAYSKLSDPASLFKAAHEYGAALKFEIQCKDVILKSFAHLKSKDLLFINVNPQLVVDLNRRHGETLRLIEQYSIDKSQIVIELTNSKTDGGDYDILNEAVRHYRDMGFKISLSACYDSLYSFAKLQPDYVRIDKHFLSLPRVNERLSFIATSLKCTSVSECNIIAEHIETKKDEDYAKSLCLKYTQGYYYAKPSAMPMQILRDSLQQLCKQVQEQIDT